MEWEALPTSVSTQEEVDAVWGKVVAGIEKELSEKACFDDVETDKHSGRSQPLEWARRPLKPPRQSAQMQCAEATRTWMWLERRWRELGHLVDKVSKVGFSSQEECATGVQRAFFKYIPQLSSLGELEQQVWKRRLRVLAYCKVVMPAFGLQVQEWHAQALANAEKHERQDAANQQEDTTSSWQMGPLVQQASSIVYLSRWCHGNL